MMSSVNGLYSFSHVKGFEGRPYDFLHPEYKKKFKLDHFFTPSTEIDFSRINFRLTLPPHFTPTTPHTVLAPAMSAGWIPGERAVSWMTNMLRQARQIFLSLNNIYGSKESRAASFFEGLSVFNLLSGWLRVKRGIREIQRAERVSDQEGKMLGLLQIIQGGASAFSGGLTLAAMALSFGIISMSAKIISLWEGLFGSLGGVNAVTGIGCAAMSSAIGLNEQRQFLRERAGLKELRQFLSISPEEKEEILKEIETDSNPDALTLQEKEALLLEKKESVIERLLGSKCLELIRGNEDEKAAAAIESIRKERMTLSLLGMGQLFSGIALTSYEYFYSVQASFLMAMMYVARAVAQIFLDSFRAARGL